MKKFIFVFLLFCPLFAGYKGIIIHTYNDEFFIIRDGKFQAKTFCLGWDEGDRAIFLDEFPFDA